MIEKIKKFFKPVVIALAVGGLAAFFTAGNMSVYDELKKPSLAPPGILFPIVWSILYILMGISSGIIYDKRDKNYDRSASALRVYGLNLVVNFFWSIIFFNMRSYLFAFVWLVLLWFIVLWMIGEFAKIDDLAAKLQIPYLLWVTFAAYLNLMILVLN